MDNSSFAPNTLSSSSTLMRLASSAEAHETPQLAAPPHPHPSSHPHPFSSAPSLDKEHAVPFSNSGFVYHHPHSLMSSSLYPPLPPFPRPSLEQGMGLIGHSTSGAFQPLGGPHEGAEPYHSAFTPAKLKPDDASCSSTFSTSENNHQLSLDKDVEGSKSDSPLFSAKEERPEGISSVGGDANSEVHSDNGEIFERGTPDSEGRSLRKSRKRAMDGHLPCCPVCGLTLRPGETEAHLAQEQEKLDRIFRGGRKSRDLTSSGRKTLTSPLARKGKDSPSPEASAKTRYESYLQIRSNRQTRLNARSRNKKRRVGEELVCPVCSERMTCTAEELTVHVDLCLKKKQGEEEEEDAMVDVEGEGGGDQFEEYTWAGQTRVRASSMLEGGFAGFGFQTSSRRMSDEEGELDVDGDDTELYGKPQFTEEDLIPVGSSGESLEHQGARETTALSAQCEAVRGEPKPSTSRAGTSQDDSQSNGDTSTSCGEGAVVAALKARLKDLEGSRDTRQKCLICLNHYQEPLVSVLCWHVHCRECWCQTLGAKKLCPQCNMITCMPNLRRIYL